MTARFVVRVAPILLLLAALVVSEALLLPGHAAAGAVRPDKRIALVIGNNAYREVEKLNKAVNDARAMADKLRSVGFEVILKEDADRRSMNQAIGDFVDQAQEAEAGLVFFAGHGVQVDGRNILLPVDVPKAVRAADLIDEGIDISRLLDRVVESRVPYTALIIDACRDNPFPRQGTRSGATTRGLTVATPPTGIYIAYSAGVNEKALDDLGPGDTDPNGLFVRNLLPALGEPGVSLDTAVKRARDNVRTQAAAQRHSQNPAIYDQSRGDLYLVAARPAPRPAPVQPATPVALPKDAASTGVERELDLAFWRAIADSSRAADFEDYLARYPQGSFSSLAKRRLAALQAPPSPPSRTITDAPSVQEEAAIVKPAVVAPPPPVSSAQTKPYSADLKPGDVFRDCEDCPEIVIVPPGRFIMGGSAAEHRKLQLPPERAIRESIQRQVSIPRPFGLGKFEITRGEFAAFVRATGYNPGSGCMELGNNKWTRFGDRSWTRPGFGQDEREPVVCVNVPDIEAYLTWLKRTTGRSYRLPTEAEWEYSARAGASTAYYWGDDPDAVCSYENVQDAAYTRQASAGSRSSCTDGQSHTAPVGSFQPNPFGLFDMLGNVNEITADCWNETYSGAPLDGSPFFRGDCSRRVTRGGAWGWPGIWSYRSANRAFVAGSQRGNTVGFRIAVTLP